MTKSSKRWIKRDDLGRGSIVEYILAGFTFNLAFGSTRFISLLGDDNIETDVQNLMVANGRIRQIGLNVGVNNRDAATICTLRINGNDSALTVTIPATQIGIFKSTRQEIEFKKGDLLNIRAPASGGAGTVQTIKMITEIEYDT